ncbi:hypothetical protein [Helicobacter cappadocius]|uniref:Glycosyltransferase n=1 Tax=Helicobacter cappadocius TaxID=3063998 RepID=A0AA90SRZ9_9HELI|nr:MULTISPECIES: hypothetical protein [unclassified Helicobacter]MDO7252502.1 hypothetical protein [Helicobacter sp. faydin-H75]MDP2538369.1 hypothetical protein [Helicobacter sp. faydin-H76]
MIPNPLIQNCITNISNILNNANNKQQIDSAINELLNLIENTPLKDIKDIFDSKQGVENNEIDDFCGLFKNKIYDLIFSKGDIVSPLYMILYLFIDEKEDKRFENLIQIADSNLFGKNGVNEEENIMLIELGSIARILAGKKDEGIKHYIKNISLIDMQIHSANKSASFILNFFQKLEIPFEIFIQAISEPLEISCFLSLEAKRRRSLFNWQLQVFWNVKHFFNHRDWLRLYPLWEKIFYTLLDASDSKKIDEALYVHFFIYHMCGNSFTSQEQWKDFNKNISQKATLVYEKFSQIFNLPKPKLIKKPKKIIAFLRDRLVENSPYKVEYSFLKDLLENSSFKESYEIKIYNMSIIEKSDDDAVIKKSYEDLGIEVIDIASNFNRDGYYNSHLAKALCILEKMVTDGVDILISPNNGYGISDFILASRVAMTQIFWSHGNFVYDIPQIDVKITHICGNSTLVKHEGYEFIGVNVKMDKKFYNPFIPIEIIQNERKKYPSNKIILGLIGRLTKIDSIAYLQMLITLMEEYCDTIFLACGNGNVHQIKEKIASINPSMLERFYFPGYVNSSIYGHIIDFWPDSFPMQQGESKIEFNAKGGMILTLSKESLQDRTKRLEDWVNNNLKTIEIECKNQGISLDFFKKILLQEVSYVAFNEDDYLKKARILLSSNKETKQNLKQNKEFIRNIYEGIRKNQGINSFLEVICKKWIK